jgi:hypothetical protein
VGVAIQAALDAQDNHPQLVLRARRRLLSQFIRKGARGRRWVWRPERNTLRLLGACVAAAVTGLALSLWVWRAQSISFHVVGAAHDAEVNVGDVIATGEHGASVVFSEGSAVGLGHRTNARVLSVQPERVRLLLESGELRATLEAANDRRWEFEAGPFRATTTGTSLHLDWDATRSALTILSNGSARVSGACLGSVREINAGEATQISCPLDAFASVEAKWFEPRAGR